MERETWNRREFLQAARKPSDASALHISSAVISVLPAERERIVDALKRLPDTEIHYSSVSKIVIVLEAPESGLLGSRLAEISTWSGVLSANMVFEQIAETADIGD
jgi:nitrate reductase NapD